ncbi:MAG: toll/interleukin-1 receptor domain-containing protein [Algoriphagus sp.]|nr:toll/interleukin-1 receptor domain-containing protein [Algoriphagus sp.]
MADNKIFVSYRRQDASGEAGRLVDHLQEVFGDDSVFLDVETIEAGLDFIQAIEKALSSCKVLIAMIGPHWATMKDPQGNLRLFNKDDFIRIEISAALKRDIRVIPVLVNGAMMPNPEDLPEDLQGLTRRHAQELSSSRWKYDSDQLTSVLSKIIEPKPQPKPQPKPEPSPRPFTPNQPVPKSWWAKNYLWVIGGIVGFLVLIGMCVPDEPAYEPIIETDNTVQTDVSTENTEQAPLSDQPVTTEFDYSGKWWIWENGMRSGYLLINQDGFNFNFEYYYFDNKVAEGTGVYDGTYLYSTSFVFYNSPGEYSFSFGSDDQGVSWYGQTVANGLVSTSELKRD